MRIYLLSSVVFAASATVAAANCPDITVSDMQGVAAGAFPQQFELDKF